MSEIVRRIPSLAQRNQRVLDYVGGRLGERTSQGQCILHIAPGGEIKKVEWRSTDKVEDIIEEETCSPER